MAKQFFSYLFEKDIYIIDDDILTDPHIIMLYREARNQLIDCTRNIDKEFKDLQDGLDTFCDYNDVTQLTDFSNEAKTLIIQQLFAAEDLLTTDFKKKIQR